jgi:catechol 2,3-dioxygenase-like lactoylglutathione lyase family enzyme
MPARLWCSACSCAEQWDKEELMRINLTSVFVDDQEKALRFYTEVLGFVKKHDQPVGEFRWLTVVSPEGPGDVELLLEPNANPAAKTYQAALLSQEIAAASFGVDDVAAEYERLRARGVTFRKPPMEMGPATIAVFEDTCGNLIQIAHV